MMRTTNTKHVTAMAIPGNFRNRLFSIAIEENISNLITALKERKMFPCIHLLKLPLH